VVEDKGQSHDDDFQSLSPMLPNLAIDLEFTAYVLDIEFDDIEEEKETEEEPGLEVPQGKQRKMLEVPVREAL
jgi:hypothetical protein